jgi:Protein of unknown function (DUF3105)
VKLVPCAIALAACGTSSAPVGPRQVGGCDGLETAIASEPGIHVAIDTPITWSSNPPATGTHYPIWAAYDRAYTGLDRGFWLHDAEHGAIVLLYNCGATPCPEIVDGLTAIVRAMPVDPSCTAPVRNRALVASDPLLPDGVVVAAVAWDVYYTASCVDPYLHVFASDHYNNAPEDLCSDGASLGGTFIEP